MEQVVELELIDLAGIKPGKSRADMLKQQPQLSLVLGSDLFTRHSSVGLRVGESRQCTPPWKPSEGTPDHCFRLLAQ
jgi:hypothetical protein